MFEIYSKKVDGGCATEGCAEHHPRYFVRMFMGFELEKLSEKFCNLQMSQESHCGKGVHHAHCGDRDAQGTQTHTHANRLLRMGGQKKQ